MLKTRYIAVAALLVSGSVAAAETYMGLDADKNGAISMEEATAMPSLADKWEELDVNVDGQLDSEEFARFETIEVKTPAKVQVETPAKVQGETPAK